MRFCEAMGETVRTRIPREHKRRLRAIAAQRGLSLSELVREHVAALIEREVA